jgi:hypothetical protein
VTTWEENDIAGYPLISPILTNIEQSDLLIADVFDVARLAIKPTESYAGANSKIAGQKRPKVVRVAIQRVEINGNFWPTIRKFLWAHAHALA